MEVHELAAATAAPIATRQHTTAPLMVGNVAISSIHSPTNQQLHHAGIIDCRQSRRRSRRTPHRGQASCELRHLLNRYNDLAYMPEVMVANKHRELRLPWAYVLIVLFV
jgi:hypothetical protein